MPTRRTDLVIPGASGCIEDRTFIGVENGELNQVPGADLFFTIARDVANTSDGIVDKTTLSLSNSVISDTLKVDNYTVHVDNGHGGKYGGCGFAKELRTIAEEASSKETVQEVISGAKLKEEQVERATELIEGLASLATTQYFDQVGEVLVETAANNGATVIEYVGEHSAEEVTVDDTENRTYGSKEANDPTTDNKPTFNLDTNHAKQRAEYFDLDAFDAEILARILTVATVRVLSNRKITELHEV